MDKKDLRPIYIEWYDPRSVDAWTHISELSEELEPIKTIGYFIKENKDNIVVSLNVDESEHTISCTMIIPKHLIRVMHDVDIMGAKV